MERNLNGDINAYGQKKSPQRFAVGRVSCQRVIPDDCLFHGQGLRQTAGLLVILEGLDGAQKNVHHVAGELQAGSISCDVEIAHDAELIYGAFNRKGAIACFKVETATGCKGELVERDFSFVFHCGVLSEMLFRSGHRHQGWIAKIEMIPTDLFEVRN